MWGYVMRNAVLALLMFFAASSADATPTKKFYLENKDRSDTMMKERLKLYIDGMGEGISWANNLIKQLYGKKLYCQPENLALNADNYLDILDRQLKKEQKRIKSLGWKDKTVLALFLLDGLQETFPCEGQQ